MSETSKGQVTRSAAEVYEEFFVPALFQEWATPLLDAARVSSGQRVLDVGCGTGVLARAAAERVGPSGIVTGIDRNDGMLAVARRLAPSIEWRPARGEALPFADAAFDAAISQFALMFFGDRVAALREMWRTLRPGGRLAVAVWDAIEHSPGYAAMAALLERMFGARIAAELRAPFSLGDPSQLRSLFAEAGILNLEIATRSGLARFPSIESWVHTDIKGWTLADMIDDAQYRLLLREAESGLTPFAAADGTVSFRDGALIVTAAKR